MHQNRKYKTTSLRLSSAAPQKRHHPTNNFDDKEEAPIAPLLSYNPSHPSLHPIRYSACPLISSSSPNLTNKHIDNRQTDTTHPPPSLPLGSIPSSKLSHYLYIQALRGACETSSCCSFLSLPPHPQNPCRKTYKQGGTQPKSWFFSVVAARQQPCKQKQHTHLPLSLSLSTLQVVAALLREPPHRGWEEREGRKHKSVLYLWVRRRATTGCSAIGDQ